MDRITHRATSLVIKGVLFANDFEGWVIALLVIIPVYFLPKLVKKKIRTFIFVQPLGSGKTSLVGKVKKKKKTSSLALLLKLFGENWFLVSEKPENHFYSCIRGNPVVEN